MSRMTDNDKKFGPFTFARWKGVFAAYLRGGDDEDGGNYFMLIAFGVALRISLPPIIKSFGKYGEHSREYGVTLSDMGNGYDFLQVKFGPQTHDSCTTKSWCKHLPWKQWDCVRSSIYTPEGSHFATEVRGKFFDFLRLKEKCPTRQFQFQDFDGNTITATCVIEEREWHRGEGWFKWLKWFYPKKIRRSLDLKFSAEVGPEKGSWKGGITGHGIDMEKGETVEQAFRRYCAKEHQHKGRKYNLKFVQAV